MSEDWIPTYDHATECLWEAIRRLGTWEETIQERLYGAFHQLARLREDELPEGHQKQFKEIIDEVRPIGEVTDSGHHKVNPTAMPAERASKLAEEILSMYHSIQSDTLSKFMFRAK
jgi:hypothetical protein